MEHLERKGSLLVFNQGYEIIQGWFTLATESEVESEAQGV